MPDRALVVQQSFPEPRPTTNPYIAMLRSALDEHPDIEVRTFSWRRAILGRYDVFHVHWPEILPRGSSGLRSIARQLLSGALLLRLVATRTPVVRTLHNLERPEGISRRERLVIRGFERATRHVVVLNRRTPPWRGLPQTLVPHGDYRPWFAPYPHAERTRGRVGAVGLVRRYKNLGGLIDAFRGVSDPSASLRIAGKASTDALLADLIERAAGDARIEIRPIFLSDADLVDELSRSEVVALPYSHMHNSGGVLAALSVGRPVLVPENSVNADLAAEVGERWVRRYTGDLDAGDVAAALRHASGLRPGDRPDLSARTWDLAADRHLAAYEAALGRRAYSR